MRSDRAHGFLIAGLINDHLRELWTPDREWGLWAPGGSTAYCPECCGPCAALRDYFYTNRGRAEADAYVLALGKSGGGYDWQLPNGKINWDVIGEQMKLGWCPNHEDALHQRGQHEEMIHE